MADKSDKAEEPTVTEPNPDVSKSEPVDLGKELFHSDEWAGIPRWTCLWQQHYRNAQQDYEVQCNRTFWSEADVLDHIRTDH